MEEPKTLVIKIDDRYGNECLSDKVGILDNKKRGPKGYVEIYELTEDNKEQLLGKHNLVVYLGREWLASRAFNVENTYITPDPDEFLCWFGLGEGGATIADPLNPTSPTNLDTTLATEIPINTTGTIYGDLRLDGSFYKKGFDSVVYNTDVENNNAYLLVKITTTIGTGDADGEYISEAGLFTCDSSAQGASGPFHLFARVTFPIIIKSVTRQLVFVWYVYF